jgi:phosphoglycerate dehydrogenase-like enzyme
MANRRTLLFLTDRGERHQQHALQYAPPDVEVIMRRRPTDVELADVLPAVDYILSERNQPISGWIIQNAPNLKLIVRLGRLTHDIDLEAAQAVNVTVSAQPVRGAMQCAEHALMMILATIKKLGRSLHAANTADHGLPPSRTDENVFAFNWLNYPDIGGMDDKRVSILGMGEIGIELARMLRMFPLQAVYYNKRTPYPDHVEREYGLTHAPLDECMSRADIVVSLLPFSDDTDLSINAEQFARMPAGSVFVHLGSGSVVDESALLDALKTGRLSGAALDTYEYEPLQPVHPLVHYARDPNSNLLLTPHTAAASLSADRSGDYAEIVRYMRGESLRHKV